jgi:hypothetical protein
MPSVVFRARRVVCAALLLLLYGVALEPLGAQESQELSGRVLHRESGVAGIEVELHRVTRDTAGIVARTATDARGGFRFLLPPADTAGFNVFFATAEHLGVRYFGPPLHPEESREGYAIAVFDTVAAANADVPVRVVRRDMVVLPEHNGGWEVNEIIQLVNPGTHTLVAVDDQPAWEFHIPVWATSFEVGENEGPVGGVVRMGERVLLLAPLVPGSREVFVRYRLPDAPPEFGIPVGSATDALNVYVAQPAPTLTVTGLAAQAPIQADGQSFLSYGATDLAPGTVVMLAWRPGGAPVNPTTAALGVLSLLLAIGAVAALWGGRGGGAGPGQPASVPVAAVVREPAATEPVA